jgi:hypothetical protein
MQDSYIKPVKIAITLHAPQFYDRNGLLSRRSLVRSRTTAHDPLQSLGKDHQLLAFAPHSGHNASGSQVRDRPLRP